MQEMMADSLNRCDTDLQAELMRNIVLGGGSSMFQGLLPRMQKELLRALPKVRQCVFEERLANKN